MSLALEAFRMLRSGLLDVHIQGMRLDQMIFQSPFQPGLL